MRMSTSEQRTLSPGYVVSEFSIIDQPLSSLGSLDDHGVGNSLRCPMDRVNGWRTRAGGVLFLGGLIYVQYYCGWCARDRMRLL